MKPEQFYKWCANSKRVFTMTEDKDGELKEFATFFNNLDRHILYQVLINSYYFGFMIDIEQMCKFFSLFNNQGNFVEYLDMED